MKYVYRINSLYDGFTPKKIEDHLERGAWLTYNWREYLDDIDRGDIVFTYFCGPNVRKGVYLVARVNEIKENKQVVAKVLRYDQENPLIAPSEFIEYEDQIFTRPRGSVFPIPAHLDVDFENLRQRVTISQIDIKVRSDCYHCFKKGEFNCSLCPILNSDFLIKWGNEVSPKRRRITHVDHATAAFWIIPKQSHWTTTTIREHPISRMYYAFKSGHKYYAHLFSSGILKAIELNPYFRGIQFDYVIGIPLSPDKKDSGEYDRVADLCKIVSQGLDTEYLEEALSLTSQISRRSYRRSGGAFLGDYYRFLKLETPKLAGKAILLIDDAITDGQTLRAAAHKIKDSSGICTIFAAAGGIMAKKRNVSADALDKFSH